ncbi:MAG: CapA family protein [Bdellovibrio sp.]|nr:CapA family protein [Bdellovibrio sp.]
MRSKILFILIAWAIEPVFAEEEFEPPSLDLSYETPCDSRNDLITLSFVGDILIHQALYRSVVAGSQHFSQIWKKTDGLINKADISVGNMEGPAALVVDLQGRDHGDIGFVYDGDVYSGTNFLFNYHPRILSDLKKSGYDLLTIANNHVLDRHSLGIDKTIMAARQLSLPVVGARSSEERNASFYQIVQMQNMRIAFIGCTEMTNGNPDTKDQVLFCYRNPKRILTLIQEISSRPEVDALVVLPHWGREYASTPEAQQKSYAKQYLEAGASVVMGSHPHVLQPWQKYVTHDGRETLIGYSLGNFVAGQYGLARKTGVVAYVGLSKEGSQKAKIFGVGYTPTYREGNEVFPIGGRDSRGVLNHVASFFGSQRRIEPAGTLREALCTKVSGVGNQ